MKRPASDQIGLTHFFDKRLSSQNCYVEFRNTLRRDIVKNSPAFQRRVVRFKNHRVPEGRKKVSFKSWIFCRPL